MLTDSSVVSKLNVSSKKISARITYYSAGQDKWGDLVACPDTPKAEEGTTVAAHPDFKFGEQIFIPDLKGEIGDGVFIVQDRGGAVKSKKASKGRLYVFDVFVKTQKKLWEHAYNKPMYMDVYILTEE
jgi:3D (Asp-Asp-Asp) domain-containing protein